MQSAFSRGGVKAQRGKTYKSHFVVPLRRAEACKALSAMAARRDKTYKPAPGCNASARKDGRRAPSQALFHLVRMGTAQDFEKTQRAGLCPGTRRFALKWTASRPKPLFAHTCGGLPVCTLIFMAAEYFAHGAGPFQGLAFWIQKPLQFCSYVRGLSLRKRAFINPRKHASWNPSPSLRRRAFNISCWTNGICRQAIASAHGIASKEDIPRKAARPATGAPYGGEA